MLKSLFAASIVSLGLLAACSSDDTTADPNAAPDDGDGGSSGKSNEGGATGPAQACTTIHKTFGVKPADYFHVFATEADAIALMTTATGRKHSAAGNANAKRAQALVQKIFDAYKKLYPESVEGMTTAPFVVIQEGVPANAFANGAFIPESDGRVTAPWVFTFTAAYFEQPGVNDDRISMTAAHELGHLFLRNPSDEYFKPIYYSQTSSDQLFGEYQTSSAEIETGVKQVLDVGSRAGQLVAKQLNGYPVAVGSSKYEEGNPVTPRYMRYIQYLYADFGVTGPKANTDCKTASSLAAEIDGLITKHNSFKTQGEIDFEADADRVDLITKQFQAMMASCLAHKSATFAQMALYAKREKKEDPRATQHLAAIGNDQAKLAAYLELSKAEKDADIASPQENIVTKILNLSNAAQDALRGLFAKPEYQKLRVFTPEDEADEAGIRIAKLINVDVQKRVDGLLGYRDANYQKDCRDTLAKGEEPFYGGFIDPHHGDCWRAYRATKLAAALQTCSASWPQ